MDKIDLDAIIEKSDLNPDTTDLDDVKKCIKEAVHQALVLASEQPPTKVYMPHGGYLTGGIDKQSILEVEKLIVSSPTENESKKDPFGPGITDYL